MKPLVDAFHAEGITVHVETSGAYPLTGDWDWITPARKNSSVKELLHNAHEFKVIVYNRHDLSGPKNMPPG